MPTEPAPTAASVYTTDEVDELLAQRDARLDDHEARIGALETGTVNPPDPPDPLPTPDGVDLLVDDVIVPPGLTTGQPATLGALVTNRGNAPSPTGAVVGVGFYLGDPGPNPAEGSSIAWASTSAGLAAGASVQLDTATAPMHSGPWYPTDAGDVKITAYVDDVHRVSEAVEGNNRLTVDVTVEQGSTAQGSTLFVPTSLWNTRKIPGAFVASADGWCRSQSWGVNGGTWGHPMTFASDADPVHELSCAASWGWPAINGFRFHMRDDAIPPASGTDGHLFCANTTTGEYIDCWQMHPVGTRKWQAASYARGNYKTGTGWGQAQPFLSSGVCAAGCPTGAGTIGHDEISKGVIPHALCFAVSDGGGVNTCGGGPLYPAIYTDSHGGGPCQESVLLLVTGNEPAGLNAAERALFVAASTYGAYQVDRLDGQPMLYVSDAGDVGAFRADKVTAIMRQARMVKTWA